MAKLLLKCSYCGLKCIKEIYGTPTEDERRCAKCGDTNAEVSKADGADSDIYGYNKV